MARFDVALNQDTDFLTEAIINFASGGNSSVFLGKAGQIIRVYKYFLVVGAATNITFQDGPTTALTGPIPLAANEAMVFTLDTKPWYTCSPGNDFVINSSGPVQVSGRAYCTQRQA